jgi:hypothetical protein
LQLKLFDTLYVLDEGMLAERARIELA